MVNLYRFDCKQEGYLEKNEELQKSIGTDLQRLGRVPWVIGGDWNMEPEQIQGTWELGSKVVRTHQMTHSHGQELDWFLTNRLTPIANVEQVQEQPFVGHHAIQMNLLKPKDWDLGKSLKQIKQVDTGTDNGTTYKDEHWDYKEGTDQDGRWYQWTTQAEDWLLNKYECNKQEGVRFGTQICPAKFRETATSRWHCY